MLENCLQAFESFVLRCPKEIGPHVDGIVAVALKFIKYDPNYADEGEEESDDMEEVYLSFDLLFYYCCDSKDVFNHFRIRKTQMTTVMMEITTETTIILGRSF